MENRRNQRLSELRKKLGMTMETFGERIGMSKQSISNIESGRREMTDRMKIVICREFGVSEKWLETGEGEMFQAETEEGRHLKKLIDEALANRDDKFRTALLEIILQLDLDELETVKRYAERYLLPALGEDADPDGHLPGTDSGDDRFAGSFAGSAEPAAAGQESQPKHAGGAFAIDGATAAAGSESRPDQADAAFDDYEPTIEEKVEAYRQALLEEEALKKAGEAV